MLAAASGCVGEDRDDLEGGEPRPRSGTLTAAPSGVHWVPLEQEDRARIVFSRTVEDANNAPLVSSYLVCLANRGCETTYANYLDIDLDGLSKDDLAATVYALDASGRAGPGSRGAARPLRSEATAGGEVASATGIAILTPSRQCVTIAPLNVYSPIFGSFVQLGSVSSNTTSKEWSFWQHGRDYHVAGGGYLGADDRNAWDINLNVTGAGSNMDKRMEFFAAGWGTVKDVNGNNSMRVDHCGWRSAYLHAEALYVRANDYVTPLVRLGRIGTTAANNYHLHFAAYNNASGVATSYSPGILKNTVNISVGGPMSIALGASATLTATAARLHWAGGSLSNVALNAADVFDNTWWKSSNTSVLRIDGSGRMTAVARGTATVSLYYSGERKDVTVTVY